MTNIQIKTQIHRLKSWTLLAGAILLSLASAPAAEAIRYTAKPGSKISIAGTSTIHDWTMDGQIIGGFLEVPAGVEFDQSKAALTGVTGGKVAAKVEASVPVRSLKSGKPGMDEVMQEAMNETASPRIQYRLTEMTLKEPHAPATPFQFDTKGELVVNKVTNVITMPVTIEAVDKTKLKATGKTQLKMTAFNVKPPAPAIGLGLIKTGDDITVTFEWQLALPATKP